MENKKFSETIVYSRSGMGITGVLFIVFLVLKLVGVIAWSWLWVLSPLWIPIALTLISGLVFFIAAPVIIFIIGFVMAVIASVFGDKEL